MRVEKELGSEDLGQLVSGLAHSKPSLDPEPLMRRLDLFVRAGDRKLTEDTIRALKRSGIAHRVIYGIPDFLIKNQEWGSAREFLEGFPKALAPYRMPELLRQFNVTKPKVDPDHWLAERSRNNLEEWTRERLLFRVTKGTQKEFLSEIASSVKGHPHDVRFPDIYIQSLTDANTTADLTWLQNVCKFPLSVQNLQLSERLDVRSPSTALAFAERAVDIPISPQDIIWLKTKSTGMFGADGWPDEKGLRRRELGRLMRLYEQTKQSEKALKVLQELTKDYPGGLPTGFGSDAGKFQGATGTREFENRILSAEKDNTNSYEYWLTRADYYGGRNDIAQQNAAYLKALDLAANPDAGAFAYIPVARSYISFLNYRRGYVEAAAWLQQQVRKHAGDDAFAKAMADENIELARNYVTVLESKPGPDAAARWLHAQLETAPFTGEYAHFLVYQLLELDMNRLYSLRSTDELLWSFMAANPIWDRGESALLGRFVSRSDGSIDETVVARMEKLAENASPTRAQAVGSILLGLHRTDQALRWLNIAVHGLSKAIDRSTMAYYLFGIYIARNDYHSAASLLPEERLSHDELLKAYSDLAVSAAKSGDRAEALRLFKKVVNDNRRLNTRGGALMQSLASLGLKEELRDFYKEMATEDPGSFIPSAALSLLE